MAKVNLVDKTVKMTIEDIIRYQLVTYCFINKIFLSELDIDCLTQLGISGITELTDFCDFMAKKRLDIKVKNLEDQGLKQKRLDLSPQSIRNVLTKVEKFNLLYKEGRGRKKISLNPDLQIQTKGNIMLNFKIVYIES